MKLLTSALFTCISIAAAGEKPNIILIVSEPGCPSPLVA